jgi:hypothetical protein
MPGQKELKNEFSWSHSRDYLFRECKRAYFHHYYGSFGGWEKNAPEEVRRAYVLKNQTSIPALTGEVIHRAIHSVLKSLRSGATLFPESASQMAVNLFKTAWRESRSGEWSKNPKRYRNIFEIYYGQVPPEEELKKIPDRIQTCIDGFLRAEIYRTLRDQRDVEWLGVEELHDFPVDDVKVYAMPDLVIRREEILEIFDWKTGREREDDLSQLGIYGLLGAHLFGGEPGRMRGTVLYLGEGSGFNVTVDSEALERARNRVRESSNAMRALLDDPGENRASIENFPQIDDLKRCHFCSFKELCGRE